MIAGSVALIATGIATVNPGLVAAGVKIGTIATVASIAATASTVGSQVLSKAPPARGMVGQLLISPDPPQPYVMGTGFYGGVLRHDAAYGAPLNDVPNPYRGMVVVYSGGGPVESITPYVDKAAVAAYYTGWLYTDTQLGDTPEASALSPHFASFPGWGASSKLSGQAAILWNLKFDKKGKIFASGVPQIGAYGQWVKAYDPRLDSTFPGGVGAHRVDDETTWEWTDNPALHFGTYAYGRHQNGKRTMGCGLTSIDWPVIAAWANVCEANGWTIFGVVYEPGNRWDNLKDIATAGGGKPVVSSGGLLSVKYWAPQVALDTITLADIAEGQVTYSPLQSWDDRVNTIVPRFTSANNEWNQVAADPVQIAGFVTEDGEEKRKEWPYNLVKEAEQAAQLAAYQIYEGREINPIVIPCLPRLRAYRPGECLNLDPLEELYGLSGDAVILNRALDPATMTVTLTLIGETPGKHAIALGQAAAPPAIPVAGQDAEDRDDTTVGASSSGPITVANDAAMLALNDGTLRVGTIVKVTSSGKVYSYNGGTAGTIADWTLVAETNVQAADAELSAIAGLTSAADKGIYFTGSGTAATFDLSSVARTLTAQTTQANMRTTGLGLGTMATATAADYALLAGATFTGQVTSAAFRQAGGSIFRIENTFTSSTAGATGAGIELGVTGGNAILQFYNRTSSAYITAILSASQISLQISGASKGTLTSTAFNLATGVALQVNAVQVVTARQTGWAAATGTATRTAIATYTAPTISNPPTQAEVQAIADGLQAWSRRGKALTDDLATHGLIGA